MDIKFCANGDDQIAIGVSRWDPNVKAEHRFCRDCYIDQADLVVCEVVGPCEITDARTNVGVGTGGRVELDRMQTNIAQLVYGGHVKVVPAEKKTKPQPAAPAAAQSTKD